MCKRKTKKADHGGAAYKIALWMQSECLQMREGKWKTVCPQPEMPRSNEENVSQPHSWSWEDTKMYQSRKLVSQSQDAMCGVMPFFFFWWYWGLNSGPHTC
jgi:hypothetical protein